VLVGITTSERVGDCHHRRRKLQVTYGAYFDSSDDDENKHHIITLYGANGSRSQRSLYPRNNNKIAHYIITNI